MDLTTPSTSLISGFAGIFLGAYLLKYFADQKIKNIRNMAISCLKKIRTYCKKDNNYQSAKDDFNNAFSIADKRSVLVALHKIGIPIEFASEQSFDIKHVSFLPERIDPAEIEGMISQIESGQCDHLFFLDPDTYFNDGGSTRKKHATAIKFIDKVMTESVGKFEDPHFVQRFPKDWTTHFSPGEMNVISVFGKKLCNSYYYKLDGQAKTIELEKLKEEVRLGMWDFYLSWDVGAFENMNAQRAMSEKTMQAFDIMMSNAPWDTKQK